MVFMWTKLRTSIRMLSLRLFCYIFPLNEDKKKKNGVLGSVETCLLHTSIVNC